MSNFVRIQTLDDDADWTVWIGSRYLLYQVNIRARDNLFKGIRRTGQNALRCCGGVKCYMVHALMKAEFVLYHKTEDRETFIYNFKI